MSLYLQDSRSIFVHIPKCGGTWVNRVIREFELKHTTISPAMNCGAKHAPLWVVRGDYKNAFTMIRHPLSWYQSWYKFQVQHRWKKWEPGNWHPQRELECCEADTFADFIGAVVCRVPGYLSRLYETYIPSTAHNYRVSVTERLAPSLIACLPGLDTAQQSVILRHKRENVSPQIACDYPPDLRDAILETEAVAIRRWEDADSRLVV